MKSPPHPDPRRHRVQPGRGVHPGRGQRDARRHRGARRNGPLKQARRSEGAGRGRRPVTSAPDRPSRADRSIPGRGRRSRRRIGASAPAPRLVEKAGRRRLRGADVARRPRSRPARPRRVIGWFVQGSATSLWPTKRRWSNANFGHVLGLPPDDPAVRRLALRAYRELRPLPRRADAAAVAAAGRGRGAASIPTDLDADRARSGASRRGGLIFVAGHIGNNEAVAAGVARRGWPINVLADDSAFPELFELLRAQRETVGRPRHPVAQPARDLRGPAAPRDARAAGRLGLPAGRHPGPPVRRLDDAAGGTGHARRRRPGSRSSRS